MRATTAIALTLGLLGAGCLAGGVDEPEGAELGSTGLSVTIDAADVDMGVVPVTEPAVVSFRGQSDEGATGCQGSALLELTPGRSRLGVLRFTWEVPAGDFASDGQAYTRYECSRPGNRVVTLSVTDGRCTYVTDLGVTCRPIPVGAENAAGGGRSSAGRALQELLATPVGTATEIR